MKTKRVNRYYCDFCKKSSCSAGHMRKHERGCTMNPDRVCGVCNLIDVEQGPLNVLVELLPHTVEELQDTELDIVVKEMLPRLRTAANDCPACIFAALRQAGVVLYAHDFDWKSEMEEVWGEFNDRESRECQHG